MLKIQKSPIKLKIQGKDVDIKVSVTEKQAKEIVNILYGEDKT